MVGLKWNWELQGINGGSEEFHGGRIVFEAKKVLDIVSLFAGNLTDF